MMVQILAVGLWQNILQLIAVIIVFVLVLVAAFYATKFLGKSGIVQTKSKNISVLETFKIAPNKYIQIIQLGTKYYAIGVSKEHIEYMTELDEEQLDLTPDKPSQSVNFKDYFEKLTAKTRKKKDE